jgi:hypothetical protein
MLLKIDSINLKSKDNLWSDAAVVCSRREEQDSYYECRSLLPNYCLLFELCISKFLYVESSMC